MKKFLLGAALMLGALSTQAQEKVMNILKSDGTCSQTRVSELKEISFLTVEQGGQGLRVKMLDGSTAAVFFEAQPVVTISSGKLNIKANEGDPVAFELTDIAELSFGDVSGETAIDKVKDFAFVLQNGGALLRDIPQGEEVRIYSLDGKCIATPPVNQGSLLLNRALLGKGIFIVKVGSFTTKVQL